jgi:hypothetical protein
MAKPTALATHATAAILMIGLLMIDLNICPLVHPLDEHTGNAALG